MKIFAIGLASICLLAPSVAIAARPVDGSYELTLAGALPDGKALQVYIAVKDGAPVAAFGLSPTYNKASHDVDASELKVTEAGISGPIAVLIRNDGWMPKGGNQECAYTIDASLKDQTIAGTFAGRFGLAAQKGAVAGQRTGALTGLMHMDLQTTIPGKGGKGTKCRVSFTVRDGKAVSPVVWPGGSIVDTSMAAEVLAHDITVKDGQIGGSIKIGVTPQGQAEATPCVLEFAGRAIGSAVAGMAKATLADKPAGESGFSGKVTAGPAPDLADGLYQLLLHGTPDHTYVHLYLQARKGKLTQSYAATPDWNNATHDVDLDSLALAGDRISGSIKVTINPDPWIPSDHKPIAAAFTLDATIDAWQVAGKYTGTCGGKGVKGNLSGEVHAPPLALTPDRVTLKIENGLVGGNPTHNRAFLGMQLADGKVTGGGVGNNHSSLKGTMTGGTVTWKEDRFAADVQFTVEAGGGVDAGQYAVKAEGPVIGNMSVGRYKTFRDGKVVKEGCYWAAAAAPKGK